MEKDQIEESVEMVPIEDLAGIKTVPAHKERPALAFPIVWGFVISVGLCFLYTFLRDFKDGLELFKTVSAVLSMPLGYVLGFYFRSK
jgi:hypothetical protein